MKIIIKGRPVSWNEIYESRHWIKRSHIASRIHDQVRAALIDAGVQVMSKKYLYDVPVDIIVTAYFNSSPLDSDNIPAKMYIDGLKYILLREDNMKHVQKVTTESKIDKEFCRVEIDIKESVANNPA